MKDLKKMLKSGLVITFDNEHTMTDDFRSAECSFRNENKNAWANGFRIYFNGTLFNYKTFVAFEKKLNQLKLDWNLKLKNKIITTKQKGEAIEFINNITSKSSKESLMDFICERINKSFTGLGIRIDKETITSIGINPERIFVINEIEFYTKKYEKIKHRKYLVAFIGDEDLKEVDDSIYELILEFKNK